MLEKIKLFFAALSVAMLTGCGHNAIVYSDGIGVNAGFDPEHLTANFTIRYGKILSVAVRDMVDIETAGEAQGGQEQSTASAASSSGIKIRIKRQINGAARDLIEAGATADQIHELLQNPAE